MINENVGNAPLTQAEKADRWDHLVGLLNPCGPGCLHPPTQRHAPRATLAPLTRREELPKGLVTERSFWARL